MTGIEESLYRRIVDVLPIACVDVVLRVRGRGFLLVRRGQEPLKGSWWVVGGRILQGETAVQAAVRKTRMEVGVDLTGAELRFRGYYEDVFESSPFGPGPYHTVSLVFEAVLEELPSVTLDSSCTDWCCAERLPERFVIRGTMDRGEAVGREPR